jgi:hypothetical protein
MKKTFAIILLALWPLFISCTNDAKLSSEMNNSLGFESAKINQEFMINNDKRSTIRKMKNINDDNLELNSEEMKKIDKSSKQAFKKLKNFYRTVARSRFG